MPTLYEPHQKFGQSTPAIDPARCRAETYNNVSRNFSQCARKVAIERGGVGYCRQHDPEAEKAREADRRKREQEEVLRRERQWKRPLEYRDALRQIADITAKQQLPITSQIHALAADVLTKWGDLETD